MIESRSSCDRDRVRESTQTDRNRKCVSMCPETRQSVTRNLECVPVPCVPSVLLVLIPFFFFACRRPLSPHLGLPRFMVVLRGPSPRIFALICALRAPICTICTKLRPSRSHNLNLDKAHKPLLLLLLLRLRLLQLLQLLLLLLLRLLHLCRLFIIMLAAKLTAPAPVLRLRLLPLVPLLLRRRLPHLMQLPLRLAAAHAATRRARAPAAAARTARVRSSCRTAASCTSCSTAVMPAAIRAAAAARAAGGTAATMSASRA